MRNSARLSLIGILFFALAFLTTLRREDRQIAESRRTNDVNVPDVNTFSIVAYDPERKEWGVGTASRVLAVGAVVPWAKAGSGAIATQSYANTGYGPKGLEMLAEGESAEDVIKTLVEDDPQKDLRQVGIVDAEGNAATFTGSKCLTWAGGKTGKHFACQGNILTGESVVNDMAKAFEETKGRLAWKIVAALEAAEKAGGDKRGKQSAALLVVREKAGYGGYNDRMIDLRVDDHKSPVEELARILSLRMKRPPKEETKKDEPKKDEPKKDEPKKDKPKKDEPGKD